MELEIVRGGGLAGMTTRTRLSSGALSPQDAEELESKVRDSALLGAESHEGGEGARHPDDLLYEVTVAEGDERHTARFSDETMPAEVRGLVEWVDARPEREFGPGS